MGFYSIFLSPNYKTSIIKRSIKEESQDDMNPSKKHINFSLIEETFQQTLNPIDTIVKNIKGYSEQNGNLLAKYNQQFFLSYFDRNTIQQSLLKLSSQINPKNAQLNLQQFIRTFLNIIQHKQQQTLFLAMSLRLLFLKIKENTNNQMGVKFSDFTNYLCERIANGNPDLIVPLKQVPQERTTPDVKRVREIDINPPIVIKNNDCDMPKIAKEKKKKDKKLIQRKPVSKFIFNSQTKQIITMGRLSSCIYLYDLQLNKLPLQITPKTYHDKTRQIAILSMAFNQQCQRIGVIINGIGIVFWQSSDHFTTQKTISKYWGQKIFYLKLFKEWITADKNTIYFWDLKEEKVSREITNEQAILINDVCEINHLRCIGVSYTMKDLTKVFVVYKDFKQIVKYQLGSAGCHTLHYNIPTQMIVMAGYHNQLEVLEVENKTYSVNLKKQLKGHTSIVTCVSTINNTNFILSGDDSGQVRIWQLNYMKCIQVVKISKYINEIYCTGDKLIFSDNRLNTMEMDKFSLLTNEDDSEIIQQYYEEEMECQFIVTRKSLRKLNLNNGRVEVIFVACDNDEEISSTVRVSLGILIGTSKGVMKLFTVECKNKWQIPAHQGEITQLQYDRKTRFIFSLGTDNKLMIWPQKSLIQDGVKKIITFRNKSFNLLSLFTQIRMLFLASSEQNQICVWDYDNVKLLTVIKMEAPVLFMEMNQGLRLLLITTVNDQIKMVKLLWKGGCLGYEMLYNGDSAFTGLRKKKNIIFNNAGINTKGVIGEIDDVIMKNSIENDDMNARKKKTSKDLNSKKAVNLHNNENKKNQIFVTSSKIPFKPSIKKIEFNSTSMQQPCANIPSIKLIKDVSLCQPQSNGCNNKQGQEQTLLTLNTLNNISSQLTTSIKIKQSSLWGNLLFIGSSKGIISCYNIDLLIKQHFSNTQQPLNKNESPHMYRPVRQDYDVQLSKHKHQNLSVEEIKNIQKVKKNYFTFFWRQSVSGSVNRQPVAVMTFIQMKDLYLTVGMPDGSCKYLDVEKGSINGNIKLTMPLPIQWDIKVEKDDFIRRNVYETLLVLDQILTKQGFEMLSKQYKLINITKFLQILKKPKPQNKLTTIINTKVIPLTKKHRQDSQKSPITSQKQVSCLESSPKNIILLHQQFSLSDLHPTISLHNDNSLKSLQAYKRVKQIKEQMLLEVKQRNLLEQKQNNDGIKMLSTDVLRQKQEVQRLLAPNYFPVLAEYGVISRLNKSVEIGSLEEKSIMLLEKVNYKRKINSQYMGNKIKSGNSHNKSSYTETTARFSNKRQASELVLPTITPIAQNNKENMSPQNIISSLASNNNKQNVSFLNKLNTLSSYLLSNSPINPNANSIMSTQQSSGHGGTFSLTKQKLLQQAGIYSSSTSSPQSLLMNSIEQSAFKLNKLRGSLTMGVSDNNKSQMDNKSCIQAVKLTKKKRQSYQYYQNEQMTKRCDEVGDTPMKQILGDINQKLNRYKKLTYGKRDQLK